MKTNGGIIVYTTPNNPDYAHLGMNIQKHPHPGRTMHLNTIAVGNRLKEKPSYSKPINVKQTFHDNFLSHS